MAVVVLILVGCDASSGERYRISVSQEGRVVRLCGASIVNSSTAVNGAVSWARSTTTCSGYVHPDPSAGMTGLRVSGFRNGALCLSSSWQYQDRAAVSWGYSRRMCPLHSGSNYRTTAHFHAWSSTTNSYHYSGLSSPTVTLA